MTFSLLARCPRTGQIGVAAATAIPAVGKLLTHAQAGIGAVATQARLNPYLGIDGMRLLQHGRAVGEVAAILSSQDPCATHRQFGVLDRFGNTAIWTGEECIPWAGGKQYEGLSVQGNRLAGEHVLEEAAQAFRENQEKPLDERFIDALAAGEAAGGDVKGERSATIYIVDKEEYPLWDIRVDAHPEPLTELRRLHKIFRRTLLPEIFRMPTRANPSGSPDEGDA